MLELLKGAIDGLRLKESSVNCDSFFKVDWECREGPPANTCRIDLGFERKAAGIVITGLLQ